jgi:23S rRNA (uracil1939-C5)-methyltransferase
MLSIGELTPLVIEKPVAGGRMIARAGGQVVLVSGAIPHERVTGRITAIGKGVAYAETVEVLEPSPHRTVPASDPACGGRLYAHIAYAAQLPLKSAVIADAFARIARLDLPVPIDIVPSPCQGYRTRARLHVRGGRLGFFREETHVLCDARATGQLSTGCCDALEAVAAAFADSSVSAELEVAESLNGAERVVHIDATDRAPASPRPLHGVSTLLTGLTLAERVGAGVSTRVIFGVPYVNELVAVEDVSLPLRRHVRSFFQGNRYLLPSLVAHVTDLLPDRGRVIDLYAGVGVFGLAAAARRRSPVVAVEGEPHAAADLAENARAVGGVEICCQPVESFLKRRRPTPDAVILDPPRTGVSREAMAGMPALAAPRLVYVSCDVATLARDARRLVDAGYAIQSVRAFDLFPETPHVESVVLFRR